MCLRCYWPWVTHTCTKHHTYVSAVLLAMGYTYMYKTPHVCVCGVTGHGLHIHVQNTTRMCLRCYWPWVTHTCTKHHTYVSAVFLAMGYTYMYKTPHVCVCGVPGHGLHIHVQNTTRMCLWCSWPWVTHTMY